MAGTTEYELTALTPTVVILTLQLVSDFMAGASGSHLITFTCNVDLQCGPIGLTESE